METVWLGTTRAEVPEGADAAEFGGHAYYDTGQPWKGARLFSRAGTVRYVRAYPAGSLEALICEAEGIPAEHAEIRGRRRASAA